MNYFTDNSVKSQRIEQLERDQDRFRHLGKVLI